MTTITCAELHRRLEEGFAPLLLDVLPPEEFSSRHLAGAQNACVYEMVFLANVRALAPDQEAALLVYDATGQTRAAVMAGERLEAAGYRQVLILTGGLAAWEAAGYQVERGAEAREVTEPRLADKTYTVDQARSRIEWTGRNLNGRHLGTIAVAGGELVVAAGALVGGTVVLDMTTISNLDQQDEGYRQLLTSHLQSADFFDVARFPTATMTLTGWVPLAGSTPGTPNYTIQGRLTIKGVTREISFPAIVNPELDGSVRAQAALEFDRTLWDVLYGSGRLFEKLGMHLVNDLIGVELFITAY
jgi:polyisoprenoid-binding protein YceI